MRTLLVLLAACGDPAPEGLPASLDPAIEAWVSGGKAGLELHVRTTAPAGVQAWIDEPEVPPLRLTPGDPRIENAGDHVLTTRTWTLRGAPGSHVVPPLCLHVDGSTERAPCTQPIYVDLGTKPDRSGMIDISDPAATLPAIPWSQLGLLVGGLGLLGAGAWGLWRRRPGPRVAPVPEEPPHIAAIRRWEALRDDPSLTPEQKAAGLSEIFRAYTEVVLAFPARAFTTTEILAHLEGLPALARTNLPRAKRLLRATDRVKYAEAQPGGGFFDELEADLHAFVDATRPRALPPVSTEARS